jgi:hypothetical protein
MGQAWRKSYSGMSTAEWLPPADPERPRRDDHRSPEAVERRRLERRDRWVKKPDQPLPPSPAELTSPPDFSVRTPEACSWDGNGRYARWLLPTHNGRPAFGPESDLQKILASQRDRLMQQRDGEG